MRYQLARGGTRSWLNPTSSARIAANCRDRVQCRVDNSMNSPADLDRRPRTSLSTSSCACPAASRRTIFSPSLARLPDHDPSAFCRTALSAVSFPPHEITAGARLCSRGSKSIARVRTARSTAVESVLSNSTNSTASVLASGCSGSLFSGAPAPTPNSQPAPAPRALSAKLYSSHNAETYLVSWLQAASEQRELRDRATAQIGRKQRKPCSPALGRRMCRSNGSPGCGSAGYDSVKATGVKTRENAELTAPSFLVGEHHTPKKCGMDRPRRPSFVRAARKGLGTVNCVQPKLDHARTCPLPQLFHAAIDCAISNCWKFKVSSESSSPACCWCTALKKS